ncbi:MAG: alpha-galactosidase [Spirochaetia bacterium]
MERTETFLFGNPDRPTAVAVSSASIYLDRLNGVPCFNRFTRSSLKRYTGWLVIDTPEGRIDLGYIPDGFRKDEDGFCLRWDADFLIVKSSWNLDNKTGVWERCDSVENTAATPAVLTRCLSRIILDSGDYDLVSQEGRWVRENQTVTETLRGGGRTAGCEGGRTCQGSSPYAAIRQKNGGPGIDIHVLPVGNWIIKIQKNTLMPDQPQVITIDAGLSDHCLRLKINPGEIITLPKILYVSSVESPAALHNFYNSRIRKPFSAPPLVYNTWFDRFDSLDVSRLSGQLDAAKNAGCEVFTVDAGWFGEGEGSWSRKVGDWRENSTGAFRGKMAEFAEQVRGKGLGFGIWIEPERLHKDAPAVKEHPERYICTGADYYYPDFTRDEVFDYYYSLIAGLIRNYNLVWIKVDFNHELSVDPTNSELFRYYRKFYSLIRKLGEDYPQVYLEGCASGGMRLDLNTLRYFHGHFLSDNVNPAEVIRIYQGALLRLPPGPIIKWAVLRNTDTPGTGPGISAAAPGMYSWERTSVFDIDFILRAALPGTMGFSGDLAGLGPEQLERVRLHGDFFKQHRHKMAGASAFLLTPHKPMNDLTGWAAIQLLSADGTSAFLFVYRLDDSPPEMSFRFRGLANDRSYRVTQLGEDLNENRTGADLTSTGIRVRLPRRFTAAVFTAESQNDSNQIR